MISRRGMLATVVGLVAIPWRMWKRELRPIWRKDIVWQRCRMSVLRKGDIFRMELDGKKIVCVAETDPEVRSDGMWQQWSICSTRIRDNEV